MQKSTDAAKDQKYDAVYQHFYESYVAQDRSVYAVN
jgi:hypothetical protein